MSLAISLREMDTFPAQEAQSLLSQELFLDSLLKVLVPGP